MFEQDVRDEGPPEDEFNPGIAGRFPRKTVAAGALIRNAAGQVLFVKPTYKPLLEIPGGMVEDNESPLAACQREVREELGIDLEIGRLLVVDWVPTHGVWQDSLQLIFDGGVLDDAQIKRIRPAAKELAGHEFLAFESATTQLRASLARRVTMAVQALTEHHVGYGELGRVPTQAPSSATP